MALFPPQGTMEMQFNGVWSLSTTASSLVPDPYVISINDHNYLHDLEFKPWKRQAMRATTTSTTRTQADTSNEPGEQTFSTESLWRRTQDSWHLGNQQIYLDRKNSTEFAFRDSTAINPWTQWQLTPLNAIADIYGTTATNLQLAVAGGRLYILDGEFLKYTSDLVSWTQVSGTPATNATSICSDGYNVYVAYQSSGLWWTNAGSGAATQLVSSALAATAVCRYVLGRLMVASGTAIYNVTSPTLAPLPVALFTSNYTNFVWTDFTAGNGVIFACGNQSNQGVVYSIQINTDGTTLAAPIICAEMTVGETINTVYGYAGSAVVIGTSQGGGSRSKRWPMVWLAPSLSPSARCSHRTVSFLLRGMASLFTEPTRPLTPAMSGVVYSVWTPPTSCLI